MQKSDEHLRATKRVSSRIAVNTHRHKRKMSFQDMSDGKVSLIRDFSKDTCISRVYKYISGRSLIWQKILLFS